MQLLKKILVAYDGSGHSKKALNWAIDLSLLSGAEVLAVKVFGESSLYDTAEPGASVLVALEEIRRDDQRMIDEAVAVGKNRGVIVRGEILEGRCLRGKFFHTPEQHQVDMIVTGAKGHGQLEALLIGSVARKLVSLAHVPVVVVKD